MIYKEIIKQNDLTCSVEEFENYLNSLEDEVIEVTTSKHTFDEKYNNVQIENPANWKYYYLLNIEWVTYLQNIAPYVWWLVPLNDDNVDEVIENHSNELKKQFSDSKKLQQTVEYFESL